MDAITIYTTPHCLGCALTRRTLDKAGISYDHIDLSQRPDLIERFKAEGLLSAPIIETSQGRSAGFRPDRIRQIIALAEPYTQPDQNGPTRKARTTGPAQPNAHRLEPHQGR